MGGGGSQKLKFPCIISLKTNKDVLQLTKRANQRRGLPGTQETGYPAPEKSDASPQEDGQEQGWGDGYTPGGKGNLHGLDRLEARTEISPKR